METVTEMGRKAYENNETLMDNPFCKLEEQVDFLEWQVGWLHAFYQAVARSFLNFGDIGHDMLKLIEMTQEDGLKQEQL